MATMPTERRSSTEPDASSSPEVRVTTLGAVADFAAASTPKMREEVGTYAVDMMKMDKVMRIGRKAICKVVTRTQLQGTGALYEVDSHNIRTCVFITCNHVLASSSVDEVCAALLDFRDIPAMRNTSFTRDDLCHVWTVRHLDATVVELRQPLVESFKSKGARFLRIGTAHLNEKVAMLQYPEGMYKFAYGDLEQVTETEANYRFGTAPGSSGSPVLNWKAEALAMHKLGEVDDTQNAASLADRPELGRTATLLSAVVDAYLQERPLLAEFNIKLSDALKFITHLQKENSRLKAELQKSNSRATALARPANEPSLLDTDTDTDSASATTAGGTDGSQNGEHANGGTDDHLRDLVGIDLSRLSNATSGLTASGSVTSALDTSLSSLPSLGGNANWFETSPASIESSRHGSNQPTNAQLGSNTVLLLNALAASGEPDSSATGTGREPNSNGALSSTLSTRASDGDSSIIYEYESPQTPAGPLINIACKRPDSAQSAGGQVAPGVQLDVRQMDRSDTRAAVDSNRPSTGPVPAHSVSSASNSSSTGSRPAATSSSKMKLPAGASASQPTQGCQPQRAALSTNGNMDVKSSVAPRQANPSPEPRSSAAIAQPTQCPASGSTSQSPVRPHNQVSARPPERAPAPAPAEPAVDSAVPSTPGSTTFAPAEDLVHQELLVTGVPAQLWELKDEDAESLCTALGEWGVPQLKPNTDEVTDVKKVSLHTLSCTLHTSPRKLEALLSAREIPLLANNSTISVHRATRLSERRVVRVTGFGANTAADVRANEGVLRDRLTSRKWQGGTLDAVHVADGEAPGSEPLVVVTFRNPRDAQNAVRASQAKAIPFVKGLKLRLELFDHPDFFPSHSSYNRTLSETPHPSLSFPGAAAAVAAERDLQSLPTSQTPPSRVSTNNAAPAPPVGKASVPNLTTLASSAPTTPLPPPLPGPAPAFPRHTALPQPVICEPHGQGLFSDFVFSPLADRTQLSDERFNTLLQDAKVDASERYAVVYRGPTFKGVECALVHVSIPKPPKGFDGTLVNLHEGTWVEPVPPPATIVLYGLEKVEQSAVLQQIGDFLRSQSAPSPATAPRAQHLSASDFINNIELQDDPPRLLMKFTNLKDANTVLERQAELPCLRRCLALEHIDVVGGPLLPYGCATFRQPPDAESAFAVRVPATLPPALLQFLLQRPAEVELFTQYLRESALQVELDARLLAASKTVLVRIWVSVDKSRAACRLARVPKWVSLSSYANDHRSEDEWRLLQQTMDDFLCKFSVVATDAVYQQLLNYAMVTFKDAPVDIRPSREWPIVELVGRHEIVENVQATLEQKKLQLEQIANVPNMTAGQRRVQSSQSPTNPDAELCDEKERTSSIIELYPHHVVFLKYYEGFLERYCVGGVRFRLERLEGRLRVEGPSNASVQQARDDVANGLLGRLERYVTNEPSQLQQLLEWEPARKKIMEEFSRKDIICAYESFYDPKKDFTSERTDMMIVVFEKSAYEKAIGLLNLA